MQRFLYTLALGASLLLLGGCGGGASTPDPSGGNNSGAQGQSGSLVQAGGASTIQSVPASTFVPGQLNIRTGASASSLRQTLDKLGYGLVRRSGDFATISIPGGDLDGAIQMLNKEYTISSAEKINVSYVARPSAATFSIPKPAGKKASAMPLDPMYGEQPSVLFFDGTNLQVGTIRGGFGQGAVMNLMGFPGAWDTGGNASVSSVPVRVAVIDAGFLDYTADPGDIDPAIIDTAHSGRIDGAGMFTAGLANAVWDTTPVDVGGGVFWQLPYHDAGNRIFQMMAATWGNADLFVNDNSGDTIIGNNEVWAEGTAGINPSATYMIIRTGSAAGNNWSFSDNELAAAINFAADPAQGDADIIVLGMSGAGAVGGNVATAISNARNNNDALVIAPAGDVMATYDETNNTFTGDPVDIQANPVTPGSAADCVSVAATGFVRYPLLGDVTTGGNPATVPNIGQGWEPRFGMPYGAATATTVDSIFDTPYFAVAPYSNYNATLGACGFAVYYQFTDVFNNGGTGTQADPFITVNGYSYYPGVLAGIAQERFSSVHSTAYIAGTASMVYQALAAANGGTFPADVDTTTLSILEGQSDNAPIDRVDKMKAVTPNALSSGAGVLNANKALMQAISGGTLFSDPMGFTQVQLNQPLTAITVGTDVQLTANVVNGSGPFSISVDWGDGAGPQVTDPWVPGTIVTLTGGYDKLGPKALTVIVSDNTGQDITASAELYVINPLSGSITVFDQSGGQVALTSLDTLTNYVFEPRLTNLYTGTFDDDNNPATPEVPNTTTFDWDFGDSTTHSTQNSPTHAYTSPGNYTVKLTVTEAFRPTQTITVNVTVQ
jgi:hypothetical protein